MRNIYEIASVVLIWLGPGDVVSDNTMEFLDVFGGQTLQIGISSLENPDSQSILGSDTKPHLKLLKRVLRKWSREAASRSLGLASTASLAVHGSQGYGSSRRCLFPRKVLQFLPVARRDYHFNGL
jgi:hypothetical protein